MRKVDYTREELFKVLADIGIERGDNLFIHSNIGFYGRMEGITSADQLCDSFIESFKEVVTEDGTIVFPTFSYSYCHSELYDPQGSKSECGMLAEYACQKGGFIRSFDPNFSVACWGNNAERYALNPTHESFGEGSFWQRILEDGGKIVCMNFDCGSTFVHYVERCCSVSYRYNKAFNGKTLMPDGTIHKDYAVHYVCEGGDDAPFFGRLDRKCREIGLCKIRNLGKGTILAMDIKKYYEFICKMLKIHPRFLTVGGNGE